MTHVTVTIETYTNISHITTTTVTSDTKTTWSDYTIELRPFGLPKL